ncbi:RHS repeat-associated core domain-containing protein [Oscillospiraceae bacterium MB08-C2-2]|nr:RHS repeat-associated core domain-containing protein [Oscillospiraceae bacterium MB08-C2-2]
MDNQDFETMENKKKLIENTQRQEISISAMASYATTSSIPDLPEQGDPKEYVEAPFQYKRDDCEAISLNSGSLRYSVNDLVIPGKNGFDLVVARQYDSASANIEDISIKSKRGKQYFYYLHLDITTSQKGKVISIIDDNILDIGGPFQSAGIRDRAAQNARELYEDDEHVEYAEDGNGKLKIVYKLRLRKEESKADYVSYGNGTRANNHNVGLYGLGHGWSFSFPSIESVPTEDKSLDVDFYDYLHTGDGRAYKLSKSGNYLLTSDEKSYPLSDIRIRKDSQTQRYKVEYKDGKTAHFHENKKLNYIEDRFGNRISFVFGENGLQSITDTIGRTFKLLRESSENKTTLSWQNTATGQIEYTYVVDKADRGNKLVESADALGQKTAYTYSPDVAEVYLFPSSWDEDASQLTYLNLTKISHPTGAQSVFTYQTKEADFREGAKTAFFAIRSRESRTSQHDTNPVDKETFDFEVKTYTQTIGEKEMKRYYVSGAHVWDSAGLYTTHLFNPKHLCTSQETRLNTADGSVVASKSFRYNDNDLIIEETANRMQNGKTITMQSHWTYDSKANVLSQTLPLQGITTFSYDTAYNLPIGKLWDKDASTQIREEYLLRSDQKLVEWKKVYEKKNGVETLKEATQYQYDANNNLSSERHYANLNLTPSPDDAVIAYSYSNANPQLDSSIYNGVYLTEKRIIGLKDAGGAVLPDVVEKYSRDAHGRALRVTDPSGRVTNYTYDRLGRVIRETYPDQACKETQYVVSDAQNHIVVSEKDASGKLLRQNRMEYTPLGKIQRTYVQNPETCLTYHTYDARNRLASEYAYSTEGTTATAYTYDAFDRILSKTTTGPGITPYEERYSYDDAFDPAQGLRKDTKEVIGDANSPTVISTVLRDVLERVREEAVGAAVTRYAYNQAGNRISQTDPLGNITLWAYDYAGRMETETRTTESGSVTAVTSYNPLGHKQNFRDFRGNSTTFLHDAAGRLLEQSVDLNGSERMITRYAYNPSGEVTSQKSLAGDGFWRETGYTYDSCSRVVDTILYDGSTQTRTRFEYDALGNKTVVYTGMLGSSIAGAAKTTYTYDRFGSVQTMTDPIGNSPNPSNPERRTEVYGYDAYGKLRTKQDRNGDLTTYTYDGLGRVLCERAADSEKKQADAFRLYVYTKTGQTAMEENSQLRIRYAYDSMGRLLSQTEVCLSGSANTVSKSYTYDLCGNRKSFILRKNGVTELSLAYDYDRQNRLTVLKKDGHSLATYTYDENGNRKSLVYPQSGITTEYVYNAANLVTELTNKKSGAHRSSYHYSYFPDGNQARKLSKGSGRADKTTDYLYDGLGRLTEEKEQGGNRILYQYDRFSNRSRMTVTDASGKNTVTAYTYDLRNRLETETKTDHKGAREIFHYRYDYNGNQLYREWERLTPQGDPEKKKPGRVGFYSDKFGQDVVILEKRGYNGFNQLVSLYRDTLVTSYVYRPDGLRHKKCFADGTSHTHIWDGQNIVAEYGESGRIFARYLRGINLIAREQDGQLQYYLFNAHGDVVERTNQQETTLKNYDYDAFGVEKNPEKLDGNPFRYCGEYFDREAGTVYLRARSYVPASGRFTSEDGARDGLNWYTYCGNNPVMFIDSSGLAPTVAEAAYMAEDIYEETGKLSGGWKLDNVITNKEGLKMGVYSRQKEDGTIEYALVNKGTSNLGNWGNNFQQPFGASDDAKDSITESTNFVSSHKDNEITMVGHSKGGAEAILNAMANDKNCITFNPANPNYSTYGLEKDNYTASMTNYIVKDEILHQSVGSPSIGATVYLPSPYRIHWWDRPKRRISTLTKNHHMEAVRKALQKEGYK